MIYILAFIISACLATAQALWGSAIKSLTAQSPNLNGIELIIRVIQSPKFWLGASLYGFSTVVYFLLLSKARFFSVQLTMTGVAIIVAIAISHFFFHENITALNILGAIFVLVGIGLVTH